MRVTVQTYSPQWAHLFDAIKHELEEALDGVSYISIEHVGSTSVPDLAAKPVIDIDIIVEATQLEPVKDALISRGGYAYQGDMGIPLGYAFRKRDATPLRNLYVCVEGCQSLLNHLTVRDVCRNDPEVREAYGRKKLELAQREWVDVDAYCEAKNDVLAWILERAGWTIQDRDDIRDVNTATSGRHLRECKVITRCQRNLPISHACPCCCSLHSLRNPKFAHR